MKADIEDLVGNHVSVYIVRTDNKDEQGLDVWEAMLYNDSEFKLENILVQKDGTIKICDFGCAGTTSRPLKEVFGTLDYMAPEIHTDKTY